MNLQLKPRKIQNMHYSFYVNLPMDWCKTHELGRGSSLQPVILENGDLLIKPIKEEGTTCNK